MNVFVKIQKKMTGAGGGALFGGGGGWDQGRCERFCENSRKKFIGGSGSRLM